jgi:hypothetical protein
MSAAHASAAGNGAAPGAPGAVPRVLLLSSRVVDHSLWHGPQYEFEDVIAEVDAVRLLTPGLKPTSDLRKLGQDAIHLAWKSVLALTQRSPNDKPPLMLPGTLDEDYDLLFAVFHFPQDLAHLDAVRGWRKRCRKAVCFIVELWTPEVRDYRSYLELLRDFDHVFVFNSVVMDSVSRIAGRPVGYMATGIDAARFAPYPSPPERVIDCYWYGRRSPTGHRQLAAMAERRELFYVHDTIRQNPMVDYRQHRVLLASLLQRSRYAMAYRINEDRLVRTEGDEGLTARLFEITAAGAVMLGSRPHCGEFDRFFDWPDALIDVPWEPKDMRAVLAELDAQPERLALARRRNVANALRRHDWVYRWQQVLEAAGMAPLPAFTRRVERLHEMARAVEGAAGLPSSPAGALAGRAG